MALDVQKAREELGKVVEPLLGLGLVEYNLVKTFQLNEATGAANVVLAVTDNESVAPACDAVRAALTAAGATTVTVSANVMTDEETNALLERINAEEEKLTGAAARAAEAAAGGPPEQSTGASGRSPLKNPGVPRYTSDKIGRVIAVASGKGGVGKSTVVALVASELARRGHQVGILDADITGPTIPKLFGLSGRLSIKEGKLVPMQTESGVHVVSMNLLLEKEEDAVVWRGPIIDGIIKQLFTMVDWPYLDFLLIDLPPGTSDAPLTVYQTLPTDGALIITTPQVLVEMIVNKAFMMAELLGVPVIGLVENSAYFVAPDTGKRYELWGDPESAKLFAEKRGTRLLAQLAMDPTVTALGDAGKIEEYQSTQIGLIADTLQDFSDNPRTKLFPHEPAPSLTPSGVAPGPIKAPVINHPGIEIEKQ